MMLLRYKNKVGEPRRLRFVALPVSAAGNRVSALCGVYTSESYDFEHFAKRIAPVTGRNSEYGLQDSLKSHSPDM